MPENDFNSENIPRTKCKLVMLAVKQSYMDTLSVLRSVLANELKVREAFFKAAEYHKTGHRMYYDSQYMASLSDDNIKILGEMTGNFKNISSSESVSVTDDYYPGVNLIEDLEYILMLKRHNTQKMNSILSGSDSTENWNAIVPGIFIENSGRQIEWLEKMIGHAKNSVSSAGTK